MAESEGSLGPISYLVVEFPGSKMTGEGLPILVDLVDRGVIRILDLVFVAKGEDGSLGIIGLADLDHDGTIDLAVFEGVSSGLVSQADLDEAAPVIAPPYRVMPMPSSPLSVCMRRMTTGRSRLTSSGMSASGSSSGMRRMVVSARVIFIGSPPRVARA